MEVITEVIPEETQTFIGACFLAPNEWVSDGFISIFNASFFFGARIAISI